jgi:hypothetical protein
MRNILLILVLSLSNIVFADKPINTLTKPGRYRIFDFMSVEVARNKAESLAIEDYQLGDYRYLVYGLRTENKSYGGYLEEHYGIEDRRVAYCIVTKPVQEAAKTYNSTMRQLLTEKYGWDVFKEAEEMSRHAEIDNSSLN